MDSNILKKDGKLIVEITVKEGEKPKEIVVTIDPKTEEVTVQSNGLPIRYTNFKALES